MGCGKEVGRAAYLVRGDSTSILLDYGVKVSDKTPEFPEHISPKEINALIVSHAHLDHIGAVPGFFLTGGVRTFMTPPTAELGEVLIKDMINLSRYYLNFEALELYSMLESFTPINQQDEKQVGSAKLSFQTAGHLPGSVITTVEVAGKKIVYPGDVNTVDTQLLAKADVNLDGADLLILEGTYSATPHPERKALEERFVQACREVVEDRGTVLVPSFSVGRSQELLLVLVKYGFQAPITLDGMAREASRILLKYPTYLRDYDLYRRAMSQAEWVKGWQDRRHAMKTPGVIISPAGMLKGGAAVHYMQKMGHNPRNAVYLVSFQVPGTPGRILMEEQKFNFGRRLEKVPLRIEHFDFSGHLGRTEILNILSTVKEGTRVMMVHGDPPTLDKFVEEAKAQFNIDIFAPNNGETITL